MSHQQSANMYISRPDCEEIEIEVFGTVFGDEVQDTNGQGRVIRDCIHNDSEHVLAYKRGDIITLTPEESAEADRLILEADLGYHQGCAEDMHLERYYFNR